MHWLRKLLSGSPAVARGTHTTFRPNLEALDRREMPSVSSVLTAGGLTQFIVDNTNSLIVKSAEFGPATVITGTDTTGVRTAQGFSTAAGGLGYDAVMMDGTLQHIEQEGGGFLPNGTYTAADFGLPSDAKILDAGAAYDSLGHLRFDILITKPGDTSTALGATGRLFEFNQAAGGGLQEVTFLPDVRWVSTYLDTAGGTGIAVGQTFSGGPMAPDTLLVRKADSVNGIATLYNGLDVAPEAITEYTQTVSPPLPGTPIPGVPPTAFGITSPATARSVIIDLTYNSSGLLLPATPSAPGGTYALEYALTTSAAAPPVVNLSGVGTDNSIKPGG